MELLTSTAFIPLWILGAPLVLALISLAVTPRHGDPRDMRNRRDSQIARPL